MIPHLHKGASARSALILGLTLIPPALILLFRPLNFTFQQSAILASFVVTILWWATGAVERTVASIFLLAVFLLGSGAPMSTVFTFPLSENFVMILLSFLFSQGIANSGLLGKLLQPLLLRFARTPSRMILFLIASSMVSIFIIPQPFSRIIVLSLIYREYFNRRNLSKELSAVLMCGLYYFSVLVNTVMIRGDIMLNGALISMANQPVGETLWMQYMTAPTLAFILLSALLYLFVFRKTLATFPESEPDASEPVNLTRKDWRNLLFLAAVVLVWATEEFHPISGTVVVLVATVLMFPLGMLGLQDWKSINVKLLIFLTAAFAVGGTLRACGVADRLISLFLPLFPPAFSISYVLVVVITTLLLHMVLGSNITTMSVVVPVLMSIGEGVAPPLPLMFILCITICSQFILSFHHVILLLGEGSGSFSTKELLQIALPHTALALIALFLLYLPWWCLTGGLAIGG